MLLSKSVGHLSGLVASRLSRQNSEATDRSGSGNLTRRFLQAAGLSTLLVLSACQFEPLYGSSGIDNATLPMGSVSVSQVDTRVGQQVRNRLLFLLHGGSSPADPRYNVELRTQTVTRSIAASTESQDNSTAFVNVSGSYVIFDTEDKNKRVGAGSRQARASFDRTAQNFANLRAERDAENRAARELAESLRLAILSDLKTGS